MGIQNEWCWQGTESKTGKMNLITDVPGVSVGHCTLQSGAIQTGVTAVFPHAGNCFREKCVAATHVINGFGKSTGLIQLQELGTLETPILLTNTFSVGVASTALIRYMLAENPDIAVSTGTVNPVVLECNDGRLNDIRGMHITEEHVTIAIREALKSASSDSPVFEEGSVGAGTGMCCYGLKGGIGSASRVIDIDGDPYTLGVLVLTNFGKLPQMIISGKRIGAEINSVIEENENVSERGSAIIVVATDLPLSARQLQRVSRRVQNGIARTGSITGSDSGEIVISFSTANKVSHYPSHHFTKAEYLHEDCIDIVFSALCEAVEESIISSLVHARTNSDTADKIKSLSECLKMIDSGSEVRPG